MLSAVDAGVPGRALGELRALAGREPLDERAHAWLMLALAGSGQQAAAIVKNLDNPGTKIVRASPLFYGYTLEGLIHAGATEIAVKQMHDRYADMMNAEFPSIRERWDNLLDSDTALLHSGGVGPAMP